MRIFKDILRYTQDQTKHSINHVDKSHTPDTFQPSSDVSLCHCESPKVSTKFKCFSVSLHKPAILVNALNGSWSERRHIWHNLRRKGTLGWSRATFASCHFDGLNFGTNPTPDGCNAMSCHSSDSPASLSYFCCIRTGVCRARGSRWNRGYCRDATLLSLNVYSFFSLSRFEMLVLLIAAKSSNFFDTFKFVKEINHWQVVEVNTLSGLTRYAQRLLKNQTM